MSVSFPEVPDKKLRLAWVKLAESLVLQDSDEYLTSVALNCASESDGAWTYTRQAVAGKTTGNIDVDNILYLWIQQQKGDGDGDVTVMLL
ncbi:hypothetical protein QE450_004195 [Paenibacillus sp. SORGH_AS306]|uniref:hypothetical protein n=1 Tax=unclassified Paenibacillus TaxID=185978 RepID=UPI002781C629|nr:MULTISPECIES: hypothetical protein [unclassified Paenibacillus]MDQ1236697.1 hypothetical protein [Paenibacillus sp. SORGH_AS_0306]MDR6109054.1 hypothetical protein [Paenibacillus sp. SORGH_AS_0338]